MRAVFPLERAAEFHVDWEAGVPVSELAAKYGCSRSTISATARRRNLEPRSCRKAGDYGLYGGRWLPRRGIQVWVRTAP